MDPKIDLLWTTTLVQELFAHGVTYFCLSPGSRSTPLVLGLNAHPHIKTFVHFDERAMAFHALGYAKASKKPVAIIVTSGTAAGNLLPAIMEAHESAIPLLVFTADRPDELQECGANQTTHQTSMFQNYVRWQCRLPIPTHEISLDYLKTTLAHAVAQATDPHPGPVHLNCPFREPFSLLSQANCAISFPKTQLMPIAHSLEEKALFQISSKLNSSKKGIILIGYEAFSSQEDFTLACALAEMLKWPIFCDVLCSARTHPLSISYYDLTWETLDSKEDCLSFYPDCILHFGGSFVSKHLMTFLKKSQAETYIHCLPYCKRQDPMHLITHRISIPIHTFCRQMIPILSPKKSHAYFLKWKNLNDSIEKSLGEIFSESSEFSEAKLSYLLANYDFSHHALFLPSSMPIRNCLQFFHPKENSPYMIYGNRGLSGIDGNIATAVGISSALASPMITLLGDQTFLHDLTSLHQLTKLKYPMIILVINNDGGTIFSFLPIYEKKEPCKNYFINSHGLTLSYAAKLFQLEYHYCDSVESMQKSLDYALSSQRHQLIEIKTDLDINLNAHQMIKQRLLAHAELSMLR